MALNLILAYIMLYILFSPVRKWTKKFLAWFFGMDVKEIRYIECPKMGGITTCPCHGSHKPLYIRYVLVPRPKPIQWKKLGGDDATCT